MTEIKEAVREKDGQAALHAGSCCGAPALEGTSPITSNLYSDRDRGAARSSGARLARLRQSDGAGRAASQAKRCSTSVRAAASTCCCRRGASVPPAKPTAST